MPQHEVWSPAARAVLLKEYISAAAEFLIIRQISMAKITAISPREWAVCWSTDPFFFTMTPMRFAGPREPSPRRGPPALGRGRAGSSAPPVRDLDGHRTKLPSRWCGTGWCPACCWNSKPRANAKLRFSKHTNVEKGPLGSQNRFAAITEEDLFALSEIYQASL